MVLGWRRAFCTSIPRDRDTKENTNPTPSPRLSSKFGFFSNPSTPRFQSPPVSSSILRCRTTAAPPPTATVQAASAPGSPKLQCKTKNSPRFFNRSTPSSPRSPSTFSLLKSSLRFPKTKCGTCLQAVKTGQGTAIFTAECSHSFHFPCIAALLRKQTALVCPVCHFEWKELPLLSIQDTHKPVKVEEKTIREVSPSPKAKGDVKFTNESNFQGRPILKVYNDDEPLMSPTSGARFNPIPESDEYDEENDNVVEEFQGFFVDANVKPVKESLVNFTNLEARLLPEAAVVSVGRSYETYVIILKLKAPPALARTARRAPIDLVMVLDVSGKMKTQNIQMMKRAMRLVISSLSSSDRLSIVAFSTTSKRLLPLRRMTTSGKRSARRIVDAIIALDGTGTSASDALKKAAKVLEDRRERNPVATIMLLSDSPNDRSTTTISTNQRHQSSIVSTCTRFNNLEIPVHSIGLNQSNDEVFTKFIGGILNVVVQDLRFQLGFVSGSAPAEVAAVYSYTNRPAALGSGSLRLGDFYAEEERELLVELKVPTSAIGTHHVLSVRCSYKDPSTQELVYCKEQALLVPRPHAFRSSTPNIQRLRDLFISTRAMAESKRMIERNDLTGAHHMLSSARALLVQSNSSSAGEFVHGLETELSEVHYRRQNQAQVQSQQPHRRRINVQQREEDKAEPLTPTSAWRAAERLAKVAIMRKSLNRVSDLHGFEDARF
ncbi:E3 ubiquitin-protein ligase WAV3-like isoform X2 [Solanum dulcamara]|uniref:E3 ubiquitin-protein ligase WAV3-like isoform X2 n=1 Tax=Solanum dulcamara TaxID=45834 RepID=UPI0024852668|nr:E3 ubiquitin-protein ligase WAV3-like isoform X2 [Solanum dulcamara]